MAQSLQGLCMSCITCVACSTQAAAWLSVCMPLLPHIVFVFISFFHFPKLHSIRGGWLAGYWYQRNHLINVTNRFLTDINNQDVEESSTRQPANWPTKLSGNISYRYQQPNWPIKLNGTCLQLEVSNNRIVDWVLNYSFKIVKIEKYLKRVARVQQL